MHDLVLAVAAGGMIGLSLGALGGGGSILAVPVLVYALGQGPAQATTGSLVVVGVTALIGAVTAYRAGNVMFARGVTFGLVATGGAAVGAKASALVSEAVLLAAFAILMLVVAGIMAVRQVRAHRAAGYRRSDADSGVRHVRRPTLDEPIITFSPTFACQCPLALKVLITATAVGLLTGFLGVGGGFLVVPALLLALALPMEYAAGTSLVVITLTSATAFGVARLVFQEGWGSDLLGFESQGFLDAWAPVFFFAMIFAIAMDYTVFLLASAKEHYEHSSGPKEAMVGSLAHSGRVIFAAGAVMVAVFFTFALSGPLPPKEMGIVLGVAVLLDAFLVRLLLLPVLLRLTGRAAWWAPSWLTRILPNIRFSHS